MSEVKELLEIKNRWTGEIIYKGEANSIRELLERAIKEQANLSRADLYRANLYSADLSSADLSSSNLSSADLSSADLSSADLSSADLSSSNLSSADLSRANLSSADLSSADLSRANLSSADLSRAKGINPHRCTPLLMLHDQVGKIRAYKLIKSSGEGPYNGGINYLEGIQFEVEDANPNVDEQCGSGINLATLDWCMMGWEEGYRILIMEFTAEDIAAIPTATDGKIRVSRCKKVGEKDLVEIGLIGKK